MCMYVLKVLMLWHASQVSYAYLVVSTVLNSIAFTNGTKLLINVLSLPNQLLFTSN